MQYDGMTVAGEDVISFIKKNLSEGAEMQGQITVTLTGVSGTSRSFTDTSALGSLTDPEDEKYIKDPADFI